MPTVSFLLPCFNSAAFLQQTLDSISAQTFKDFECIAIDDGSTDATLNLLQAHAAKDARFVVITRENHGLIATLNEAIVVARGEWLARIDADDICTPDRIDKQLARLIETGADVCGAWVRFIGDRSGVWQTQSSDGAIKAGLLFNSTLAHPTVMLRASLVKAQGYDAAALHAEDYALWCRLAKQGASFTGVPEVLLEYRCHAGQITQSKKEQLRATAQKIRLDYASHALPLPLQPVAAEFVELAEPGQSLSVTECRSLFMIYLQLLQLWPESRAALSEVWLDTLQRTQAVNLGMLLDVLSMKAKLAIPSSEKLKWRKQLLRIVLSDTVWQMLKRGRA
ncbi:MULTISPECIES: glycosyltransferase family 2 protein [Deefgea]|uniref:Glycosyltransferase n=1 Tax=Deefgea chitinilytica TaxID=570276 RepID=A0ABS2CC95_9NEIS|nr:MULTISPECIES: glycosyltransferase family 2 protein [Deefgea]MBM5571773.1 glycosyltransferase [Deefgea chitinilytica]MBM9889008.1 glycosyltransferase family 2 protein [Deefgea sp. CFH1-16]